MPEIVVAAERRTETGKNVNRRLRGQGRIPGVLYGAGKAPLPVSVSPKEIGTILRSAAAENTLFDLEVEGKRSTVILKEYQLEPIKGKLLHADFYEVALDKMLQVPVHVELQGTPVGVKLGGQIDFVNRVLEVECLPTNIPDRIVVDVTSLEVGQHLRVSDITPPANVKILSDPAMVIVNVEVPRAEVSAAAETAVATPAGAEPEVAKKGKEEAAKPAEKKAEKK